MRQAEQHIENCSRKIDYQDRSRDKNLEKRTKMKFIV